MNNLKSVYQSQLQPPPPFLADNGFDHLLQELANEKYDSEEALTILSNFFAEHRLNPADFPIRQKSYTRTILLKEKTGFEIMIARWDRGAVTPIHGHPRYSMIYVIEGELSERFYIREKKRLMEISTLSYRAGDYSYYNGDQGTFDNAIHKITAIKNSLSLHIYSDDGLKGEVYSLA